MNKDEFIYKSKIKHGDKYDYSKVVYRNNKSKVIIACPTHGDFIQEPKSHYLLGSGCQKCYGNSRKTIEKFIEKSNEVHNGRYYYNNVNYINRNTKVSITCPTHGDFLQTPNSHLNGFGCSSCSGLKKMTSDEFIARSKLKHNNKYSYTKTEYINQGTKVKIVCDVHGDFLQSPNNHLRGAGCRKCKVSSMLSNTGDFIIKSEKIHGDLYSYIKVNYINNMCPVTIICKNHGDFEQTPHGHLNGRGCSKCKMSKMEQYIEDQLKVNNVDYKKQLIFKDLGRLRFDFGLFIYDSLICLIEYNGEQHYKFVEYFHISDRSLIESKKRDELKYEYCLKNNIKLHIIKYDDDISVEVNKIIKEYDQYSNNI